MTPSVGVVVVTHNSRHVVDGLLDSLPEAAGSLDTQVIFADNASTDGTVEHLRSRGQVALEGGNDGYAAGINRGVTALAPDVPVLVLNPDVVLQPDLIPIMLARLEERGVGVVAPRILGPDGSVVPSLRRTPTVLRSIGLAWTGWPRFEEVITDASVYESPQEVAWATGAVLLLDRRCLDEVWWDPSWFLYSEETDFCLRAADRGWRTVYEPEAVCLHLGAASGWSAELYAIQILNRVRLHGHRRGELSGWAMFAVGLMREARLAARNNQAGRVALTALLRPSRRPPPVGLGARFRPWRNPGHTAARRGQPNADVPTDGPANLSVIVPAHDEARTIERLLRALLNDPSVASQLDIVVVCNGCTDDTASRAAAHGKAVAVVEEPEASKTRALASGLARTRADWVAIVDADVEITGNALRQVVDEMRHTGALAGGPHRVLDLEHSHWVVRSYYAFWQALPNVRAGLFGRGVVVVSPTGRRRLRDLDGVLSDDLVISESFPPASRHISRDAVVRIRCPRSIEDLVRRRTRVAAGVQQAQGSGRASPESRTTLTDIARLCIENPGLIIHLPAFLGITVIARRASARAAAAGRQHEWLRDDSSRA